MSNTSSTLGSCPFCDSVIPALAEDTSKRAFELLFDHIEALAADYEVLIEERGVVINRIDVRKTQAKQMIE